MSGGKDIGFIFIQVLHMVIEHRLVHFAEPFFNDFPTAPCKCIGTALNMVKSVFLNR